MKLLFAALWLMLVIGLDPHTGGGFSLIAFIETIPAFIALALYLRETVPHIKKLNDEWNGK